jgi:uncharacterized membrane protein YccC
VIVVVAGLAAAIGPLIFAIGAVLYCSVLVTGFALLSAAIIPIAVGLVVLLGVYLNLRDNTKKTADATIELTSAQKLMQTVTDEATSSIVDQKTKLNHSYYKQHEMRMKLKLID